MASFLGFLNLVQNWASKYPNSLLIANILFVFLSVIYVARLLGLTLYYYSRRFLDSIYGDAVLSFAEAFAEVHLMRRRGGLTDDSEFARVMTNFCNTIKVFFDKKTNSKCSVSVKVIDPKLAGSVTNFCRDSASQLNRDKTKLNDIDHKISFNTRFNKIVIALNQKRFDELCYLNDNIEKSKDYESTSKLAYEGGILPFNSEIVVPILPFLVKDNNIDALGGFICVDCVDAYKFDIKYDKGILKGVADGIYDLIMERNSLSYNTTTN